MIDTSHPKQIGEITSKFVYDRRPQVLDGSGTIDKKQSRRACPLSTLSPVVPKIVITDHRILPRALPRSYVSRALSTLSKVNFSNESFRAPFCRSNRSINIVWLPVIGIYRSIIQNEGPHLSVQRVFIQPYLTYTRSLVYTLDNKVVYI